MAATQKRRTSTRGGRSKTPVSNSKKVPSTWVPEVASLFLFALFVFLFLSFVSHQHYFIETTGIQYSKNLMGRVGDVLGGGLFRFFGWSAILPVLGLGWVAVY